jgi:hypothetical protein
MSGTEWINQSINNLIYSSFYIGGEPRLEKKIQKNDTSNYSRTQARKETLSSDVSKQVETVEQLKRKTPFFQKES